MFESLQIYLADPRYRTERMIAVFGLPFIVLGLVVMTVVLLFHHREIKEREIIETRTAYELAILALNEGRAAAAEGYLRESIDRHEKQAEALLLLGELLTQRRQFDAAIVLLEQSMALQPMARQFFARGQCLAGLGRDDLALADFQRAATMAPSDTVFTNKYYLFLIDRDRAEEVRKLVRSELQVGLQTQTGSWLVATAALALMDGKTSSAELLLQAAKDSMAAKDFNYLLTDPALYQHRKNPAVQRFFPLEKLVP